MKVFPKIDASKINQILADFLKKKNGGKKMENHSEEDK